MTVSAAISGSGELQISGNTAPSSTVILANSSNSYTGGTLIGSHATLEATVGGALSTGNVTVNYESTLVLDSGSTNYISSSADLILHDSTSTVDLNFSGTDTIAGLSLNDGSTYLANGTYGSSTSG